MFFIVLWLDNKARKVIFECVYLGNLFENFRKMTNFKIFYNKKGGKFTKKSLNISTKSNIIVAADKIVRRIMSSGYI